MSVSKGPAIVQMPSNLVGDTCPVATAALSAVHVTALCPSSKEMFSPTVPLGDVARVLFNKKANPSTVPVGSSVILQLSKGPTTGTTTTTSSTTTTNPTSGTTTSSTTTTIAGQGPRAVPNVVGDGQAQVEAAMHKAVLYYKTTGPNANTPKWTIVVSESPAAGTMVPYKSTVVLTVK